MPIVIVPTLVAGYFGYSWMWPAENQAEDPPGSNEFPWWAWWFLTIAAVLGAVVVLLANSPVASKDSAGVAIARSAFDTSGSVVQTISKQVNGWIDSLGRLIPGAG